jgi:uncharacterized protein (TIGR02246 family)
MTLKQEIQARQDRLAEAVAMRDADSAAMLYTEDACLIPQAAPTCTGRSAIAAFFAGAIENGIGKASFTTDEVDGDEVRASETGHYALYATPPGSEPILAAEGRYLIVWRKVDGEWRIYRDMFNTL